MIHQLRIYEIFEHNKASFHDRFRDHAARIMRSYGFEIIAIWETRMGQGTEFVYLLAWPDEQTMHHAWELFRADEEWKKIKKLTGAEHSDLVGTIEDRTLIPTSYSPSVRYKKPQQDVERLPTPDLVQVPTSLGSGRSPRGCLRDLRSMLFAGPTAVS